MRIHPSCLSLAALLLVGTACSSNSGGTPDDGGTSGGDTGGSGTTQDTGGGTCTLASTCLGAFLGTCFDPTGTCTATGSLITYSNGAKLSMSGSTWTATSSTGASCYTVDASGGTYTFHVGSGVVTLTTAGNQTRFVCPDGSPINFTTSAFDNSECALYVPTGARCAGGGKH